ncbi:hypothetical protein CEE44_03570 [Candidatus Woesearchaeota archaeon B3_Woes]|nr:MAG: hypothetical protein CEE44_03570 [Candidatus Woesearchaeota archaeon B3_Woes]
MNNDIIKELKKQNKWLRFLAFNSLRGILRSSLENNEQKRIYQLSDGKNSTNEISKKLQEEGIKISHMTVYNYWKRWNALGIVEPSEKYSGRFKKIVNLDNFNLN